MSGSSLVQVSGGGAVSSVSPLNPAAGRWFECEGDRLFRQSFLI